MFLKVLIERFRNVALKKIYERRFCLSKIRTKLAIK
jgi:hypothetical protein